MRILVTGASGLLGINLALEAAKNHTVYGLVNQHDIRFPSDNNRNWKHAGKWNEANIEEQFRVIQTDLLVPGALEKVLDQVQPDWIIHCAALAIVDACEADPKLAQQLNSEIPARLALQTFTRERNENFSPHRRMENVARGGARLLHISTDAVFDGDPKNQAGWYDEKDTPNPLSTYSLTKLAGERAVLDGNPEALVARVNLVGWSMSGKRSLAEFFYNNLQAGRQVLGFTDVFFCPLLVNHLAGLLITMLENQLHGLYHVVSRECISKYEYGLRLARRFGLDEDLIKPVSVDSSSLQASRSKRLCLSTEKISRALGKPMPGIDEGIEGLFLLHEQDYPELLHEMAKAGIANSRS